VAAGDQARFADAAARDLLQRSRDTIVQNAAAGGLRALTLKGRVRVPDGDGSRDGLVEVKIRLPDRFLRVDTFGSTERRSGFSGRTLLTPGGDLRRERALFTRLMLGLIAWTPPDQPLVFKSTGETAFADTAAVDVDGPGFSARLVLDAASLVPLRVVYFTEGGVSMVVSFANRRSSDGVGLPSRITTQTPDRVLETVMIDDAVVNPELTDRDFRP
jgi:hypothetical protein